MSTASTYKVRYGNIAVSYLPDLDGGGTTFGQQFVRVVRDKLGHVEHAFEFCAGPGFIGFSLLAHGLCDRLTVADINPAAVRVCEETVRANGLQDRVKVYLSDGLDSIPASEQWDLVVSNPPHWPGNHDDYQSAIRLVDPGFAIHQKFYRDVKKHLKPNASVIMQENGHATRRDEFVPMIEHNGLHVVDIFELERQGPLARWLPKPSARAADARRQFFHRVLSPLERLLMVPRIERLVKDNDLYRAISSSPLLIPSPFYFIWSKVSVDTASRHASSASNGSRQHHEDNTL